jgi:hypothetical protein
LKGPPSEKAWRLICNGWFELGLGLGNGELDSNEWGNDSF